VAPRRKFLSPPFHLVSQDLAEAYSCPPEFPGNALEFMWSVAFSH
jgi:hypothetical protein